MNYTTVDRLNQESSRLVYQINFYDFPKKLFYSSDSCDTKLADPCHWIHRIGFMGKSWEKTFVAGLKPAFCMGVTAV